MLTRCAQKPLRLPARTLSLAGLGLCPSFRQAPNEPWKITVRSGACAIRRTRRRRALDGALARLKTGPPGGWQRLRGARLPLTRCGAQPVPLAAGASSAPTPPWPGGPKSGTRRPACEGSQVDADQLPGGSCAVARSALLPRGAGLTCAGGRARRALRALEAVEKVLTDRALPRCPATMPCHDALPRCPATMPCHDALPRCPATAHRESGRERRQERLP
jgi:hypothetical protein